MITPGHVGVGEPATQTAQIDNVTLQNTDALEVERQAVAIGDPEAWDAIASVASAAPAADARGLVVRVVGLQADNYDSGLVDILDVLTPVTAVTTKVTTLLVINDATTLRHLTLKDGATGTYFTDLPLPAKSVQTMAFGGALLASGVSMNVKATQGAGVRVQVVGRQ